MYVCIHVYVSDNLCANLKVYLASLRDISSSPHSSPSTGRSSRSWPFHTYIHTYIHMFVHWSDERLLYLFYLFYICFALLHAYIHTYTCIHTYIHTYSTVVFINRGWAPLRMKADRNLVDRPTAIVTLTCQYSGEEKVQCILEYVCMFICMYVYIFVFVVCD